MSGFLTKYVFKGLFLGCCLLLLGYLCYVLYATVQAFSNALENIEKVTKNDRKFILLWTHNNTVPFSSFPLGRDGFTDSNCQYANCYLSNDKDYFSDLTEWDALLFHIAEYTLTGNSWHHPFPKARSSHQEYILASTESSHYYPICDKKWNNYFNWTMTYKLDSDIPWEYFVIRNLTNNQIVGPEANIPWKDNMMSLSEEKKHILKNKTKAVAWFVSNCHSPSKREVYAGELKKELEMFDMVLDVFGGCGSKVCDEVTCNKKLQDEYLFYLSFENSFAIDYTTEKFLTAMRNNVVPIVWGASDYSRFAPPNSYINAREMSAKDLAILLHRLVNNIDEYAEYLKWQQYYSYHSVYDSYETHPLCKLCKALNDPQMTDTPRVRSDIRTWWNGESNKNC